MKKDKKDYRKEKLKNAFSACPIWKVDPKAMSFENPSRSVFVQPSNFIILLC